MKVIIGLVDTPNKNGRVYTRSVLENIIANAGAFTPGMLGMPVCGTVDPTKVSHHVKNLRIEGDHFVGDVVILDTPHGNIMNRILSDVDFRVAGTGVITNGVVSDFTLRSIDAVSDGA